MDKNLDEEHHYYSDNTDDGGSSSHDEDLAFEVGGFTPTCSQSRSEVEATAVPNISTPLNLSAAHHEFNEGIFLGPAQSSHSSISELTLPRLHLLDHFEQSPASATSGRSYHVNLDHPTDVPWSGTFLSDIGLTRNISIVQASSCLFPLPDEGALLLRYFVTDLCSWVSNHSPSKYCKIFLHRTRS